MNKNIKIPIIIVLVIAVISLGIAFAAFSATLTINGNGTIEGSKWEIVFEGLNSEHPDVLGTPQTTGSASVTTAPTIKNDATEISSFVASLRTPGDSITYNFKIHNTGDYAATVSSVVMASGVNLITDTSKRTSEAATLNAIEYKLYYTDNNVLVGTGDAKDCLEPGESENVTLRIVFSSSNETNTNVLPSSDLLLDNLGVTVNYNQSTNGSCASELESDDEGYEDEEFSCADYAQEFAHYDSIDAYSKVINNKPNLCISIDSVEHCYLPSPATYNAANSSTFDSIFGAENISYLTDEELGCHASKTWEFTIDDYVGGIDAPDFNMYFTGVVMFNIKPNFDYIEANRDRLGYLLDDNSYHYSIEFSNWPEEALIYEVYTNFYGGGSECGVSYKNFEIDVDSLGIVNEFRG